MNKHDYKDQELDLKMRIKFLNKKLREPDHGVEKYEEWQSNLEMVTEEFTKLQVRKFKFFLGKWVHNFKESNQLINVVDCMFVALEKEDQKDMAMKWYMRVTDPKETRCLEKLLEYKTAEVNMWKANIKTIKKQKNEAKHLMKKQCKESIRQSKEMNQRNYDTLHKQHVAELKRYREYIEQLERGPAKSFWQVEPSTAVDNCRNFISSRPKLLQTCADILGIDPYYFIDAELDDWDWILRTNIAAGILHCRIKYWRVPEDIESGQEGLAKYWKEHYNTIEGAGTIEHFLTLTEGKL